MGKYSIKDLDAVVARIMRQTGLSEEDIAVKAGVNKGYISQCRSRGEVSNKFYENLLLRFPEEKNIRSNGNGNAISTDVQERLIQSQEREIETLRKTIAMLEKQLETNLEQLNQTGRINHVRLRTILECLKLLRSKALKEPLELASQQVDNLYLQMMQDTFGNEKV
jgi:hypothetical protein